MFLMVMFPLADQGVGAHPATVATLLKTNLNRNMAQAAADLFLYALNAKFPLSVAHFSSDLF